MTANVVEIGISFEIEDTSGQKRFNVNNFNRNATVDEMIAGLTQRMGLPLTDANGNKTVYRAFSKSSGKHLRGGDCVGDAVEPGESIVLQPNVNAGGGDGCD